MICGGSLRYDVLQLKKLIESYVNDDSDDAKISLENKIITGDELIDALGNIDNYHEEYEEVKESYKQLIKNIEHLVKGKEGSFATKVMVLLDNAKEKLEEG